MTTCKGCVQVSTRQLILISAGTTVVNTTLEASDASGTTDSWQSDDLVVRILGRMDGQLTDLQIWNTVMDSKNFHIVILWQNFESFLSNPFVFLAFFFEKTKVFFYYLAFKKRGGPISPPPHI